MFETRPFPFIVGCGRSGNTLLRLMLDSHPEMAIPPETDFLVELATSGICEADEFARLVIGHWRFADLHVDPEVFTAALRGLDEFAVAEGVRTLYRCYAAKFAKSRCGDKTPFYAWHLPAIAALLPETRFIHVIRDGRDVAASMIPLWFGADDGAGVGRQWREVIAEVRRHPMLPVLEVRYESLVRHPAGVMREVLEFCELPWSDEVLHYDRRAGARIAEVTSDAQAPDGRWLAPVEQRHFIHRRLNHPPRPDRIGAWRTELSPEHLEGFMREAGDLLAELEY